MKGFSDYFSDDMIFKRNNNNYYQKVYLLTNVNTKMIMIVR